MSAAPRSHPARDELGARRTGIALHIELPRPIVKLLEESQAKFGVTKKQIVVSALLAYFTSNGQHPDMKDLMRLARDWLRRQSSAEQR